VVAADGRFSETRRAVGIPADMLDFGKSMLVCRMQHDVPHQMTAWEWFHEDWTLALLPLQGAESSAVVTLPDAQARRLERAPETAFNRELETRFQGRLGRMKLTSSRHVYPLVASFSRRFYAPRCALIGDAAVGMHPVTAHGFNLGLRSQEILLDEIRRASACGLDWASDHVLRSYESAHRRASLGLYLATNAIVRLYTDPRPLARACRSVGLRLADRVQPFKRSVLNALTDAGRR
jgi:ubiquinone biosynthesis UbiH/UbiF/VisC/COQ6 family hydroxylase